MSGKKDPKIPLTTIAERGDLILHVGGTKDAKRQDVKKLLVSSAILIQLSKVFAAPLGPHFREGQASRSESDPHVIELPEDNANAIEDMCNLLHLNVVGDLSRPKAKSDAPRVLCLAVAIDKYDLVDVLRLQWLGLLHAISTEGPQLVAAAAYVLDQPDAFWAATRRWTMDGRHVSIHESLRHDKVCRYLPARIFGDLRSIG
ncbi:putative SKP1/BTB/POZ domain superfamily protein [Septoria linicola]|nr:putative SKP1/BTB/POZ domain superfamily protein [Septoria linicola]